MPRHTAIVVTMLINCWAWSVATAQDGPPPFPAYQDIGEPPPGNRLAPGRDGEALYRNHCGQCHLPWGMGTNMLTAQRAAQGLPPESGLLANRDDLTADYVRTVVRHGTPSMPPLTRVQVTDQELDAIADWLARTRQP